jgi:hypothetical protein
MRVRVSRRWLAGRLLLLAALAVLVVLLSASVADAAGGGPVIERHHVMEVRLEHDDLFLDLCGIDQTTTFTQVDSLKTFPDGSQTFHVERSFIPDDPRLPIERDAATAYFAPDHITMLRLVGKPLQLIGPDGGVRLLDAGQVLFGDPRVQHGREDANPAVTDLAPFYCPPPGS